MVLVAGGVDCERRARCGSSEGGAVDHQVLLVPRAKPLNFKLEVGDTVMGMAGPFVRAFNKASGAMVWRTEASGRRVE